MTPHMSEYRPDPSTLAAIVIEVSGRRDIPIRIEDRAPTAYTDYSKIVLSAQAIPKGITQVDLVRRLYHSLTAHEAGHIAKTSPNRKAYDQWVASKPQHMRDLAHKIDNVIEDPRVDSWCIFAWPNSFGASTDYYIEMMRPEVEKAAKDAPEAGRATKLYAILIAKGCYFSKLPATEFTKDAEIARRAEEAVKTILKLRYGRFQKEFVQGAESIYKHFEDLVPDVSIDLKFVPAKQGGELQPTIAIPTEPQEPEEGPRGKGKRMAEGMTEGVEFPAPRSNMPIYYATSAKVAPHVRRLLELLKRMSWSVRRKPERWRQKGRLMFEVLSLVDAAVQMGRPRTDIFEKKVVIAKETEKVVFGVYVDFSGSMDFEESREALCTLSDVAGKWLKDEEFALMVFASQWAKIKTFLERYDLCRGRIGGMSVDTVGGSTIPLPGLKAFHKLFNAVLSPRRKVFVMVSDFDVSGESETKEALKLMAGDGITVLAVGMGTYGSLEKAQEFSRYATYIPSITQLPELFARIWDWATEKAGING